MSPYSVVLCVMRSLFTSDSVLSDISLAVAAWSALALVLNGVGVAGGDAGSVNSVRRSCWRNALLGPRAGQRFTQLQQIRRANCVLDCYHTSRTHRDGAAGLHSSTFQRRNAAREYARVASDTHARALRNIVVALSHGSRTCLYLVKKGVDRCKHLTNHSWCIQNLYLAFQIFLSRT